MVAYHQVNLTQPTLAVAFRVRWPLVYVRENGLSKTNTLLYIGVWYQMNQLSRAPTFPDKISRLSCSFAVILILKYAWVSTKTFTILFRRLISWKDSGSRAQSLVSLEHDTVKIKVVKIELPKFLTQNFELI